MLGRLDLESDRRRAEGLLSQLRRGEKDLSELSAEEAALLERGPLLDLLLELSAAARYESPDRMVLIARAACSFAEQLGPSAYGSEVLHDLRARAWAELGNAYRVAEDLEKAAGALARSLKYLSSGSQREPGLSARVAELTAAMLSDSSCFEEAADLLERTSAIYEELADSGAMGRVLVRLGLLRGYAGEPERGIVVLLRVLRIGTLDRSLRVATIHGLALNLVDANLPQLADKLIRKSRGFYYRSGKLNKIRLCWLEGKIAFALEQLGRAEGKFNTARLAFAHSGKYADSALVALDLALLLLRQERRQETLFLVEKQILWTLRHYGIAREAIASVVLLQRSLESSRSTDLLVGQVESIAKLVSVLGNKRAPRKSSPG